MIKLRRRGLRSSLALFFLSPLVGEYLLGNTPITDVASLLLFAPMYGGGALLIREIARRTGRGWPAMILFAAAYALLEEGPIDMMLWNPRYGGADIAAAYPGTHIPFLGTSGQLLLDTLAVHTIWSISVPIAITETFSASRTRPWLGNKGLTFVAVIFVLASAMLSVMQIAGSGFIAAPAELAWCAAVIAALILTGFLTGREPAPRRETTSPRPWMLGAGALAVTTLYWQCDSLPGPRWAVVGAQCALFTVSGTLCGRWSQSRDWNAGHRLALAAGTLLTYVWLGLVNGLGSDEPPATAVTGSIVFGTSAVVLLVMATRRIRKIRPGLYPGTGRPVARAARHRSPAGPLPLARRPHPARRRVLPHRSRPHQR